MVNQWIFKLLLLPLALLYGLGVTLRNTFYSIGLLKGSSFSLPVISVGNLTVGGTGKTPHTEYLIRLLSPYLYVAVLSRGYKRKTLGYLEVLLAQDAEQSGDEPLLFKRKYPHISVAVAESRSLAIPLLLRSHPEINVILLDDGFQHREVVPGLSILLTEYKHLFTRDFFLPVGRLREWRSAARRADLVVVTKCPPSLSTAEMISLQQEVAGGRNQPVFFSHYQYGVPYQMYNGAVRINLHADLTVLLVVAIAGTEYLLEYLSDRVKEVRMMEYRDHHSYDESDIHEMARYFGVLEESGPSIMLTTEKDAMRLDSHRGLLQQLRLPIYILPVAVVFNGERHAAFDAFIKNWLLNFKR